MACRGARRGPVAHLFDSQLAGAEYPEQEWRDARAAIAEAEQDRESAFPEAGFYPLNAGWRVNAERAEQPHGVTPATQPASPVAAEQELREQLARHRSSDPPAAGRSNESGWGV